MQMLMTLAVVAILAFGVFWGFIRKMHRTLFRFFFLLIAMGLAFLLAKLFSPVVSGYVFETLKSMGGEEIGDLMAHEETAALIEALCRIIAAPFLFLAFYMILKPITWIPYKIFAILFGVRGPRFLGRLSGAAAGLLCGLVGLVVFVTPVFGYMTLVDDVMERVMDEEEMSEKLAPILEMTETPVAKQVYSLLGEPLFNALTSTTLDDEKITLRDEVESVIVVVEDATVLLDKSPEEYGKPETDALKKLSSDVGHSHIVSTLLSSFLSEAADSWLKGEEAFGVPKPDMGKDMEGIMDAFLGVFVTSNSQNIESDLNTFASVFELFIEHDMLVMLSDEGETVDFVEKLVSDGVVADIYQVLDVNPRMKPVKTSIIDTGMRVMLDHLGVSEELQENHGEMMEDIVQTVQSVVKEDGTLDKEALATGVQDIMQKNDFEISEEVAQIVADGIADVYTTEELEDLTVPELVDKLVDRFADAELPEGIPDNWQDYIPQK